VNRSLYFHAQTSSDQSKPRLSAKQRREQRRLKKEQLGDNDENENARKSISENKNQEVRLTK